MICSLIAQWDANHEQIQRSQQKLAQMPQIEIGESHENRMPLVLSVDHPLEAKQLTDWLANLEGMASVKVVYVHFEDLAESN